MENAITDPTARVIARSKRRDHDHVRVYGHVVGLLLGFHFPPAGGRATIAGSMGCRQQGEDETMVGDADGC